MNTDQITIIPQNYRWPNGLVLTEGETVAYNLFQTKIEQTKDEGIRNSLRNRRRQFVREVSKAAGLN